MRKRRPELSMSGAALIYNLGRNPYLSGPFSNSGGGFDLRWGWGKTVFQDTFLNQPGATDLVAGRDAAKWPVAAYLTGASPNIQYDGAGHIQSASGIGPPAVRMYSVPIAIDYTKPHTLKWEGCGISVFSGGQQASLGFGMESDTVPNFGVIAYAWNGGLAGNNTGANFSLNLAGVTNTYTGAKYSAAAGATLFVTSGSWNGSKRTINTYLNGVLVESRDCTTLPTGTQNRLRFIWSAAQAAGTGGIISGTITATGFQ